MNEVVTISFANNGFYIARGLLDAGLVDRTVLSLKSSFDNFLLSAGMSVGATLEESMKNLYAADLEAYKRVVASLWRKMDIYNLLHDRRIVDFISQAFGWENIYVAGGQVLHIQSKALKVPGGYFGFTAHQDWPSVRGSLDGMVVWVPLVDIDKNLYPLEVIPGSHKDGLLPLLGHEERPWETHPDFYDEEDFIPVEVQRGDVVFMSYFTVHRSGVECDAERIRLACSTRFDNGDEPTFIERAYPTAYVRSVDRGI